MVRDQAAQTVDAIRLCLQTAAADYYRISRDDFHVGDRGRAETFSISCRFEDLSTQEQGAFLELLTNDGRGNAVLDVTFKAQLMYPLRNRVSWSTRTGEDGKGPALDGQRVSFSKPPTFSLAPEHTDLWCLAERGWLLLEASGMFSAGRRPVAVPDAGSSV